MRLAKEQRMLADHKIDNISGGPIDDDDPFSWQCAIAGDDGTPFAGAVWTVAVRIPPTYPFCAPTLRVVSPAWHPELPPPRGVSDDRIAAARARLDEACSELREREVLDAIGRRRRLLWLPPALATAAPCLRAKVPERASEIIREFAEGTVTVAFLAPGVGQASFKISAHATVRYARAMLCHELGGACLPAHCTLATRGGGPRLADGERLRAGTTVVGMHRLAGHPCGPIRSMDGACSSCFEQAGWSPALSIVKLLLRLKAELHAFPARASVVSSLLSDVWSMDEWSLWTDASKVANPIAAELLIKGRIEEYKAEAVKVHAGAAAAAAARLKAAAAEAAAVE